MNKVSFFLKEPKAETDTAIYMQFRADDSGKTPMKYYIGGSVNPKNWNFETQRPTERGTAAIIRRITERMDQLDVDARVSGKRLTEELVRASLDRLLDKTTQASSDMFPALDTILGMLRAGKIVTIDGRRYSEASIKSFEDTKNTLQRFRPGLALEHITMDTYREFLAWCVGESHSLNYTGAIIKNWKRLMGLAHEQKIHNNEVYKDKNFKRIKEENDDIWLTDEEIQAIIDKDLSFNSRWDLARDWFILQCHLGLRVSDLVQLTERNIDKGFIIIATEKTDEPLRVPIHPVAKAILKKHKGLPPYMAKPDMNRFIKQVARAADIKDKVLYSITKGGVRKDEYLERWEMVGTHTARRRFITKLRLLGVPNSIIMKLTGITSERTLLRYDKLTAEDAAKKAAEHPYFKGKG